MDILLNDLAIAEKFDSRAKYEAAFDRIMRLREYLRQHRQVLKCKKWMLSIPVVGEQHAIEVVQGFDINKRRAIIGWLGSQGPFWDDSRHHSPDAYLECNEKIVTDTAIGEAGYSRLLGHDYCLISPIPSDWSGTPLTVAFTDDRGSTETADIQNFVELQELSRAVVASPVVIQSWERLETICRSEYTLLTIAADCFEPLRGVPFFPSAADKILGIFAILDTFKACFDDRGTRTQKGQELYQQHFTGERAWFSESSDDEIRDFGSEMTFKNPVNPEQQLFCSYHGKINTPKLRVHFSWPITATEPLYVVYAGPKITKR